MDIIGIGTDIIEIERIKTACLEHDEMLGRLFTPQEIAYCQKYQDPMPHFAVRFAAKEAISKALGTGIGQYISWLDLDIVLKPSGQPTVVCSSKVLEHFGSIHILLTLSHCKAYATATALVMQTS